MSVEGEGESESESEGEEGKIRKLKWKQPDIEIE